MSPLFLLYYYVTWISVINIIQSQPTDVCLWYSTIDNYDFHNGYYTNEGTHNEYPYYAMHNAPTDCPSTDYYIQNAYYSGDDYWQVYSSLITNWLTDVPYCEIENHHNLNVDECNGQWEQWRSLISYNHHDTSVTAGECPSFSVCEEITVTGTNIAECSDTFDVKINNYAFQSSSSGIYWFFNIHNFMWYCSYQLQPDTCEIITNREVEGENDEWFDLTFDGDSDTLLLSNGYTATFTCLDYTESPTNQPTSEPTDDPTTDPTVKPSDMPTDQPSVMPTVVPTKDPTSDPTHQPTHQPTNLPTDIPSEEPTADPSSRPTYVPSESSSDDSKSGGVDDESESPTSSPEEGNGSKDGGGLQSNNNDAAFYEDSTILAVICVSLLVLLCCLVVIVICSMKKGKKTEKNMNEIETHMAVEMTSPTSPNEGDGNAMDYDNSNMNNNNGHQKFSVGSFLSATTPDLHAMNMNMNIHKNGMNGIGGIDQLMQVQSMSFGSSIVHVRSDEDDDDDGEYGGIDGDHDGGGDDETGLYGYNGYVNAQMNATAGETDVGGAPPPMNDVNNNNEIHVPHFNQETRNDVIKTPNGGTNGQLVDNGGGYAGVDPGNGNGNGNVNENGADTDTESDDYDEYYKKPN